MSKNGVINGRGKEVSYRNGKSVKVARVAPSTRSQGSLRMYTRCACVCVCAHVLSLVDMMGLQFIQRRLDNLWRLGLHHNPCPHNSVSLRVLILHSLKIIYRTVRTSFIYYVRTISVVKFKNSRF